MAFRDFLTLGLTNNPDGLENLLTFGLEAGPGIGTGTNFFKEETDIYISKEAFGSQTSGNTVKISVKDFSYGRQSITEPVARSTLSGTDPRGSVPHIQSISPVNFSFTTSIGPILDTNVTSPEEYLWVSLMGVDTLNSSNTSSTIDFSNGDVAQLQDLTIWFNQPTHTIGSYRLENCVIDTAEINFGINQIAEIVWRGRALSITADDVIPTFTNRSFDIPCLRNKITTIALDMNSEFYNLALIGGSLRVNNNNIFYGRVKLGETTVPVGHYTGKRVVDGNLNFYMKEGTNTSLNLFDEILSNVANSDYEISHAANITIDIGGVSPPNIQIRIPQTLLSIGQQNFQPAISLAVPFVAQEEQNNFLNVIYQV